MIKKSLVKSEIELDELSKVSTSDLLDKIEKTCTDEEFKLFYKDNNLNFVAGNDTSWNYKKTEVSPALLRYLYINRKEYGNPHIHIPYTLKYSKENIKKRILDFGCGSSVNVDDNYNKYYLLDINKEIITILKRKFINYSNVIILSSLSEAFDLGFQFDIVRSTETLEHVRFLNEHIQLLYRLCKDDGLLYLSFPLEHNTSNHVANLFEDTKLRYPYNLLSTIR